MESMTYDSLKINNLREVQIFELALVFTGLHARSEITFLEDWLVFFIAQSLSSLLNVIQSHLRAVNADDESFMERRVVVTILELLHHHLTQRFKLFR